MDRKTQTRIVLAALSYWASQTHDAFILSAEDNGPEAMKAEARFIAEHRGAIEAIADDLPQIILEALDELGPPDYFSK